MASMVRRRIQTSLPLWSTAIPANRNQNIRNTRPMAILGRRHFFNPPWSNSTSSESSTTTRSHEIKSRILPGVHPLHLFRIVQDVDAYQSFLPLCSHSAVFPETIADGGRSFRAELVVGFGLGNGSNGSNPLSTLLRSRFLETRYVSEVSVDPEKLTIETKSGPSLAVDSGDSESTGSEHSGMFESLTSRWKLRPLGGSSSDGSNNNNISNDGHVATSAAAAVGTVVDFRVEMTVSDPVVVAVLNQVLSHVAESQVRAFADRCSVVPPPTPAELHNAEAILRGQQEHHR